MKLDVIKLDGGNAGSVELDEALFGLEPRADILQRVVRWQLAKRQAGTHHAMTRNEVSRTGKKMAGHMGAARVTTQNLEVVKTDAERGLVFIKGAVPGSKGGWVTVKDAMKKKLPDGVPFPAALKSAAAAVAEAPADEAPAEGGEA